MKKLLFILIFILLFPISSVANDWIQGGYIEYKHGLISNEPSLIGNWNCPCIGYNLNIGLKSQIFGYNWLINDTKIGVIGQTRWDDPEAFNFNSITEIKFNNHFSLLFGYDEYHNLDRPAHLPDYYVNWNSLVRNNTRGWSGIRTLWSGFRIYLF